jgi:hypothetical protein
MTVFFTARPPFGQKIVPIFSFFFVWAGTLWALVTSPDFGAGKLKFSLRNLLDEEWKMTFDFKNYFLI